MARSFDGSSRIICSPGAVGTTDSMTFAAVCMPTDTAATRYALSGEGDKFGVRIASGGSFTCRLSGNAITPSSAITLSTNTWYLLAVTKTAGTSTPRFHRYDFASGSWTRSTSVTSTAGFTGAPTNIYLGDWYSGGALFIGTIAAAAFWSADMTDDQVGALATSLHAWRSSRPVAAWLLDQGSTSQKVLDWTGGGANESSITGTGISSSSVPILGYGHPTVLATRATGTTQNLFSSETPSNGNVSEFQNLTVSTTFTVAVSGAIPGGRFYAPSTVGAGTYELVLWQVTADDSPAATGTGTELARARFGALTPSAWNTVSFAASVPVSPGVAYRIGVATSDGRYTATGSFFSTPLTNGDLTGIQDGTDPVGIGVLDNGAYIESITAYPNKDGAGTNYLVDPTFVANAAGGTASAGSVAVAVDAATATVVVVAAPGAADVSADGQPATAVVAAAAGVADTAVDAFSGSPTVSASAGAADVSADAHPAQIAVAAPAGAADVDASAFNPAVSTSSSVTANAGVADVGTDAGNASVVVAVQPAAAEVGVDGFSLITAVIAAADVAAAVADGYNPAAVTSTSTVADAVTALAAADAYAALCAVVAAAGVAGVDATAWNVPKQRRPGRLTAGSTRSRLSAGTHTGPGG